jgi:hypothetical protein
MGPKVNLRRHYTESELAYIAARYAVTTTHVIAQELRRSVHGIRQAIQRHGIKRRACDKSRIYSGWSRQKRVQEAAP